jgi:tRNA-modifying protein YgfZ
MAKLALIENPLTAQRAILSGDALVHLSDHTVVSVSGEDRLSWLHSLLSQNIKNLRPGQSTQALLLDPQGHIEQILNIFEDGETAWIIVAKSTVESLLAWLRRMVFRMKVAVADRSDEFEIVGTWGKALADAAFTWVDGWQQTAPGGHRYGEAPTEPWNLQLNAISVAGFPEIANTTKWASVDALDALRIAAHRPGVSEVDAKSLPHELDLLASAVHLSKGCYRGQETVAKVHNLGHPPRRLVLLHLDGSVHTLPYVGDQITLAIDAGKDLVAAPGLVRGHITSVAQHHEMGPIALAVILRGVPLEATLAVLGDHEPIAANQEEIVPANAGKVANVPRPSLLKGHRK